MKKNILLCNHLNAISEFDTYIETLHSNNLMCQTNCTVLDQLASAPYSIVTLTSQQSLTEISLQTGNKQDDAYHLKLICKYEKLLDFMQSQLYVPSDSSYSNVSEIYHMSTFLIHSSLSTIAANTNMVMLWRLYFTFYVDYVKELVWAIEEYNGIHDTNNEHNSLADALGIKLMHHLEKLLLLFYNNIFDNIDEYDSILGRNGKKNSNYYVCDSISMHFMYGCLIDKNIWNHSHLFSLLQIFHQLFIATTSNKGNEEPYGDEFVTGESDSKRGETNSIQAKKIYMDVLNYAIKKGILMRSF